jgi:hypothetical protein
VPFTDQFVDHEVGVLVVEVAFEFFVKPVQRMGLFYRFVIRLIQGPPYVVLRRQLTVGIEPPFFASDIPDILDDRSVYPRLCVDLPDRLSGLQSSDHIPFFRHCSSPCHGLPPQQKGIFSIVGGSV